MCLRGRGGPVVPSPDPASPGDLDLLVRGRRKKGKFHFWRVPVLLVRSSGRHRHRLYLLPTKLFMLHTCTTGSILLIFNPRSVNRE